MPFVTAVANPETVPQALMHNLKHNQVLHERNLILTVVFHDVPWIPFAERVTVQALVPGFWRVQVNYGFKNTPDIPKALELCKAKGLAINLIETSYFLSREIVVPTKGAGMARWREALLHSCHATLGVLQDSSGCPTTASLSWARAFRFDRLARSSGLVIHLVTRMKAYFAFANLE